MRASPFYEVFVSSGASKSHAMVIGESEMKKKESVVGKGK